MPPPAPVFDDHADHARSIREGVLRAADPSHALGQRWPVDLGAASRVRLLVIGKAAVPMARTALRLLGASGAELAAALVVTSPHPDAPALAAHTQTLIADHPLATERNLDAAQRVAAFVSGAGPDDTLLLLLSGGGSALLTWPADGLTLTDLREGTSALLRAGAPIGELNCVRKHCERLKGGRLARLIPPGVRTLALIVSDVLGDPLDVISSGPLWPDPTTFADAMAVLERHGLTAALPRIVSHLGRGVRGEIDETPKPRDDAFARVSTRVIAGNQQAALAARDAALRLGFARVKLVCRVEGEAARVGRALVRDTLQYAAETPSQPVVVIYAGETTVTVGNAPGLGGRNQELALAAAIELDPGATSPPHPQPRLALMTLATDGIDGPTDAAGALITSDTPQLARARSLDLAASLERHDSHHALDALSCLIRTGPTGANVNDVTVALAYPRGVWLHTPAPPPPPRSAP